MATKVRESHIKFLKDKAERMISFWALETNEDACTCDKSDCEQDHTGVRNLYRKVNLVVNDKLLRKLMPKLFSSIRIKPFRGTTAMFITRNGYEIELSNRSDGPIIDTRFHCCGDDVGSWATDGLPYITTLDDFLVQLCVFCDDKMK